MPVSVAEFSGLTLIDETGGVSIDQNIPALTYAPVPVLKKNRDDAARQGGGYGGGSDDQLIPKHDPNDPDNPNNRKLGESEMEARNRIEKEDEARRREDPEQYEKEKRFDHYKDLIKKYGDHYKPPKEYRDSLDEGKIKEDPDKNEPQQFSCAKCGSNEVSENGDLCDSCKAAEGQFDDEEEVENGDYS